MNAFVVRPAQPEDVPHIFSLVKELAHFTGLSSQLSSTDEALRDALFSEHPACEAIVGCSGTGDVIAYALFFQNYSTFMGKRGLYLEDLYVRRDQRAQGYGTRLLASVASVAVERDCGRFEWSVQAWNTQAVDFYRKLGAHVQTDAYHCRVSGIALQALAAYVNG